MEKKLINLLSRARKFVVGAIFDEDETYSQEAKVLEQEITTFYDKEENKTL